MFERAGETAWRARLPFRMPRRTWFSVALRAGVVEKAADGDAERKIGVNREGLRRAEVIGVVSGRRVAGEKRWRTIEPTILAVCEG